VLRPQPGGELCDVGGRVLANTLEDVDEIVVRIDLVQPRGRDQALDDANMLGAQLGPAERNRSLSGVLLPAMLTRNNRPPVQSGGTRSDQSDDGKQQQVAAA
jgi:hypothetical protein